MANKNRNIMFGILVTILVAVVGFLTYYVQGRGKTHMQGLDFSNYSAWLLFFSAIMLFGLALFILLWRAVKPAKGGKHKGKIRYTAFYIIGMVMFLIGTIYCTIALFSVIRAWNDNAKTADITVNTAASGDFQINSAYVESYHDKDSTTFKWLRIISFDDRYRISVDINCTNWTSGQLYNGTTATLQGYNLEKATVTSAIAPNVQPGDFTESGGAITVTFDDVPRQADSPDKQIIYFNLTLKNSDGLLASWIIHTHPELGKWTLDTTV